MWIKKHWWGFYVYFTHREACQLTNRSVHGSIASVASGITAMSGGYLAVAGVIAAVMFALMEHIRQKNQNSGYKGVRVKISWAGIYLGSQKQGKGRSPC
jgi:hypothetical protein